jgi:hypothetical protein
MPVKLAPKLKYGYIVLFLNVKSYMEYYSAFFIPRKEDEGKKTFKRFDRGYKPRPASDNFGRVGSVFLPTVYR